MNNDNFLDVLACELELRPVGAPGIAAVARAVRNVKRDSDQALVVSFDPAVSRAVEAFVAAERRCCSTLTWALEQQGGALRLTIGAQPGQLDVLEPLFARTV